MSRYTIRRPEFMKGAEQARYFPNTAAAIGISLLIFIAFSFIFFIPGIIYGVSLVEQFGYGDYSELYSQDILIFSLYFEAALIALTLIYVHSIEKRKLGTIGLVKRRFALRYAAGFGVGLALLAIYSSPLFLSAPVHYTGLTPLAAVYLGAFMVQSAAEEVLFRGYLMTALARRGSVLWAVVISTAVFALFHMPGSPLTICMVALLGVVLALFMLRTGSIWGAMGLHAAWNFATGCIAPVDLGPYRVEYAVFSSPAVYEDDHIYYVIAVITLFAAIAVLLFAGKNRLVVRKTEQQVLHAKALKLAGNVITDSALRGYVRRVTELAEGDEGKTAALLYHPLRAGIPAEYIRREFGDNMFFSVDALAVRYGETPEGYWNRVSQYPAAMSVKRAESRLDEMKRPKAAKGGFIPWPSGAMQCPMLRWCITGEYCFHIMQAVDGNAPAAEDYIALLDHDICRECPVRCAGRYNRTVAKA